LKPVFQPCSAGSVSVHSFRIPHFTHRSASVSALFDSAFYFPHSTIPHFTNTQLVHRAYEISLCWDASRSSWKI